MRRLGRITEGNLETNLRIVDEVEAVTSELGATPAQVALAWLLAEGERHEEANMAVIER